MAKVTHVKKAQQRYATVPVIDPETGEPRRTPVIDSRTGQQKQSKRGPVWMNVTQSDKSKPLPPLDCDFSGCDVGPEPGKILPGQSYKHITPKSGPYGGYQKNRHAEHPNWQIWEYSSSTSARVAQVQADAEDLIDSYDFSVPEDFDDLRDQVAQMAGELRDEKQEALDNMPEGLADGSQTQEQFDALESWVGEIEGVDAPDYDDSCLECEGTGSTQEDRWFVVNKDGSGDVFEDEENGFESEDEAQARLDDLVAQTGANPDDVEIEIRQVDIDCEQCGGEGTLVDEVSLEWADEAKDIIREALSNCDL